MVITEYEASFGKGVDVAFWIHVDRCLEAVAYASYLGAAQAIVLERHSIVAFNAIGRRDPHQTIVVADYAEGSLALCTLRERNGI